MECHAPPASSIAQRSIQKTSGPFNTDLTGVANDVVASVDQFFAESDANDDLFATTKIAVTDLQEAGHTDSIMVETSLQAPPLLDLKTAFDLDFENSSDFLESFTDLSNFLLDGADMDTTDVPVVDPTSMPDPDNSLVEIDTTAILDDMFKSMTASSSSMIVEEEPTPTAPELPAGPVKRKRSDEESCASSPLADHSGYASRPKRPRISSTVSSADGTDAEDLSPVVAAELKYRDRRNKNNMASKRSRQTRKQKFVHMEEKAIELERANEELRHRVVELEELAKEMKDALVKRLAK